MAVPRMLLARVLNPDAPEALVCISIAQLARKPEHPAEEAFEILIQAYAGDPREAVDQAVCDGVLDVLIRAPHTDPLARQLDSLRAFRGDRFARLLAFVVASRQVPTTARQAAVAALATHDESDLSGEMMAAIEATLRVILFDVAEDAEVRQGILKAFGPTRTARPHVYAAAGSRDDETTML